MTIDSMNNKSIETLKQELLEMERVFCEASGKEGAQGWAKFFSENGVMVPSKHSPIEGPDAIKSAMTPLFQIPDLKFVWTPIAVDVSADGTLGYTYGTYERSYTDETGASVNETGKYMTVWKRQTDGQWRIAADIGN